MSTDIFTVRDSKLASADHVENWKAVMEPIRWLGAFRS
jgi:hypothetical protein